MSERTIVITGASDGIGAAAARALSERGDRVVVVGRSPDKTRAVATELGVEHHLADFAQLGQVRSLADALLAAHPRIDVLINNAGAVMGGREITADGFEKTFAVNHLAPFLLTQLLHDRLIASRASVITTASAAHRFARLRLDDLDFARGYSDMRAYGTSKLANILFSSELHRRHHDDGLSTASVHPGVIASNFGRQSNPLLKLAYSWPFNTPDDHQRAGGRHPGLAGHHRARSDLDLGGLLLAAYAGPPLAGRRRRGAGPPAVGPQRRTGGAVRRLTPVRTTRGSAARRSGSARRAPRRPPAGPRP